MTDPAAMGWLALVAEATQLEKELAKAQVKSIKAAEARSRLAAGATRARVTTANARWAIAAEARDRVTARRELVRDEIQKRMERAA